MRKKLLMITVGLLALVLSVGVASCGGGDEEEEGGATATTPSGAEGEPAPPEDQVLIVQSTEPEFFDPHRSNFEQDIMIERMLFRGLYNLAATEDGSVEAVPAMAEGEPEVSEDGTTFTVQLKSGLMWSDGEALTAQHFVDGIRRGCSPTVASPYAYLLQSAAVGGIIGVKGCDEYSEAADAAPEEQDALRDQVGATAIDDTTLEIQLVDPKLVTTFKQIFSLWITFPARVDVIDEFGEKWTDPENIVTNGPFTLTEFAPKDHVKLEPNPNWTLEPTPLVQDLTVKFIDDPAVSFRAYQTGELDMVNFPESEIPTVEGDPTLSEEFVREGTARMDAIEMQLNDPTLQDFNVRLALSRAIDRETLNEVVYNGASIPATYWLVEGLPGFQGNAAFEDIIGFDADAAKAALEEAGYPDGEGFPELTLLLREDAVQKALGEFLQNQWKTVLNIDVKLEFVDSQTRSQRFNEKQFQLFRGGWQLDYPDPENPIVGLFDTGGGNNKYECSDPDIDAKITEGSAATDFEQHVKAFQEAETLIVTKLCGVAPITQLARVYLVNSKIGGVIDNGTIDAGLPGTWCAECWFVKQQ